MNPKQNAKPLTPAVFRGFACLAACLACWLALPAVPALAADATWNTQAGNWNAGANWIGGSPGTTSGTTSTDTAWFSRLLTAAATVTVDPNRNIRNITFDGGNSSTFGYTLSGGSLLLTSGGTISATGAAGAHTDTISAPMTILGNNATYTISNDSAIATRLLSITGNITGQSTTGNTTTLTLGGSNAGTNTIHLTGLSSGTNGGVLALVKEGATTWRFTSVAGQHTQIFWSGPITIKGGSLLFSSFNQAQQYLNANSITLDNTAGAQLDMGTASLNGLLGFGSLSGGGANGGNIVNAGFANQGIQIGYDNTSTTYGGRFIAGQTGSGITKVGTGTLTLTGSGNDAGGTTNIRGGTLGLDFSQAWTGTDILASTRAVSFEGGRLLLTGSSSGTNSQTFASTTVAQGNSGIALTSNGASALLASLGAITRNTGGTLDITLPTDSQSTTNGVRTTSTTVTNGVTTNSTTAYLTVGGTTWGVTSGTNVTGLSSYATGAGNYTSTSNVDVGAADSPAADRTVNTLRFNGNNTLTLSGTNTIGAGGVLVTSAATTGAAITGGTLRPGSGNELVLINNGAQFTVGSVIANNGANAAALTLSGTGTTILNGLNTYTGVTSINGSTVKAGNSQAFGINSAVTIADNPNAVLDLNGYDLTLGSLAGTISRGNTYATAGGSVLLGGNTLTVGASNTATILGARISGSGNLVKVGTSSLELAGNNTAFTGGIVVKSGSLVVGLGGNNSLGSATVTLGDTSGNNNATLSLNQSVSGANVVLAPGGTGVLTIRPGTSPLSQTFNGTVSGTNDVVISAAVNHSTFTVSGTINNVGKVRFTNLTQSRMRPSSIIGSNVTDVTIENNINDNGNGTTFNEFSGGFNNTGVLQFTGSGVAATYTNVTGVISSASGITVNPTGSYEARLSAANTFTAPISIQAGTLRADNAQAFGINSPVTLANAAGATLQVNGVNVAIGSLSGGGATGGRVSFTNSNSILTTGGDNTSTTFSGSASGAGGFTKVGTGMFTLSGSNAYTGVTTVAAGVLRLDSANALPGGIASTGGSAALTINGGVIGLGNGDFTRGLGTGTNQVQITGGGGFAAYGADRTVNLGNASGTATWGSGNFITTAGGTFVLGAASATNMVDFQNPIALGAAGNTRTIRAVKGSNSAVADAQLSGILSGTANLTKVGDGRLRLTAVNSYIGATRISEGILEIGSTGRINTTSGITIDGASAEFKYNSATALTQPITFTQGTISGTGSIATAVAVGTSDVLSPGNSPGIQAYTSGLTFAPGGQYTWEINNWSGAAGTAYDQIAVSGSPLNITANSGSPFKILITSLTSSDAAGAVTGFSPGTTGTTFTIATSSAGITGFNRSNFAVDWMTAFGNVNTVPTNAGFWLSTNTGSTELLLNYAPSATYTLSAAASASAIRVGGASTITATITSSTAAVTNPDRLGYTGLALSGGLGALNATSGTIAGGESGSGSVSYTGTSAGSFTFTPAISTATNVNLGTSATAGSTSGVSVTVWNPAVATTSGSVNLGTVIVGSTAAWTQALSVTNSAPTGGLSEGLNASFGTLSGVTTNSGSFSLLAAGSTNNTALAVALATGSVGNLSGAAQINFATDGQGTSGLAAAALDPQTVNVYGTVLDHALPGFLASGITNAYADDVLNISFGSIDESAGAQFFTYSLLNLASQTYGAALTAGLDFTGVTADGNGFASGLSTFNNLLAGGTSSQFTLSFTPTGHGTFSKQFTLSFSDNRNLAGASATRDLTINAQVIVVPEPGAIALAGIGIAAAAYAYRRRRS